MSRKPKGSFDRAAYQRDYMKIYKRAKKLGMTVAEYRKAHPEDDR